VALFLIHIVLSLLGTHLERARRKLAPIAALGVPILEMVALEPEQTREALAPWLANKRKSKGDAAL
ncbi:hypothetical protein QWA_17660, partial [Alcaligenes faecalis subsp. faecalis NCIB 8687]